MLAKVYSCAVIGLEGMLVEVEVDIAGGMPAFTVVGLGDVAVQESRERVRSAIRNSGLNFPFKRLTVNLAPADLRKAGPAYDLPIAVGLLLAGQQVEADAGGAAKLIRARKAVIFGTGGFTHNLALRTHFQPGPLYGGCAVPTNEGDFVFIAQAAGAQLSAMNSAWNAEIPLEPALDSPSTPNDIWQPAGDSMILVNKYGKRVVNEKRAYNDRTKAHFYWDPSQQEYPNQVLCMIYDQRSRDLYAGGGGGYPMPAPGTTAPRQTRG